MLAPSPRTCSRCFRIATHAPTSALYRSSIHTRRKLHGAIVPDNNVQRHMRVHVQPSFQNYFSANDALDRGWLKNGVLATMRSRRTNRKPDIQAVPATYKSASATNGPSIEPDTVTSRPMPSASAASTESASAPATDTAPHRRRWMRRKESDPSQSQSQSQSQSLPLDASSRLTTAAAALPQTATFRRTLTTYLSLSKPRLSFLILLTTTSAYSLYPIPEILSSAHVDAAATLSTSTLTFLYLTTGTFLSCASANAINMLLEPKSDALMTRTRNRPLVRGLISPTGASLFAAATAATGLALLYFGTNPTVAALSGLNIVLYGFVYTPLKRLHWLNTWVGAIVGGIPPLMGWVAAAGQAATVEHHSWKDLLFCVESTGGWLLAALLFAWQFPHFNSLSHTIRHDYRNAGLKMLAWVNPARNARVAVRYSVLMFPICAGLYSAGLVSPGFLVISTGCNAWMLKEAMRFARYQGEKGSARGLFWASVWQLPLVLVGALVCKTGIWDGFWAVQGTAQETELLIDDKNTLGMDSALSSPRGLSAATEDQRAHNFAMMGFKRPS